MTTLLDSINSFIENFKTTRKEKKQAINIEIIIYFWLTHVQKIVSVFAIISLLLIIRSCYFIKINSFWSDKNLYIFTYSYRDKETKNSKDSELETITVLGPANKEIMLEVENTKSQISNFCRSNYEIDVTNNLNNLEKVFIFNQDNTFSESITYGYINTDEMAIYLNQDILTNKNLFKKVLIHESFHYLGLSDTVNNYDSLLIEGLTEAVTEECMNYLNMDFKPSKIYIDDYNLAKQMICADNHELVKKLLNNKNFDYTSYINNVIGKSISLYDSDNADVALTLDASLYSLSVNLYIDENEENLLKMQAQHIVAAYCKHFNLTKKDKEDIKRNFIINNFDTKKFLYNPETNEINFK